MVGSSQHICLACVLVLDRHPHPLLQERLFLKVLAHVRFDLIRQHWPSVRPDAYYPGRRIQRRRLPTVLPDVHSYHICDGVWSLLREYDSRLGSYLPVVPPRYRPSIPPQPEAAARCSFASHVRILRGATLLVPNPRTHCVRPGHHHYRGLRHKATRLGFGRRSPRRRRLRHPNKRHYRDYEPTSDDPSACGIDRWIHASRPPSGDDDLQDVLLHLCQPGDVIPWGPQARPLHEDPATHDVLRTNHRDDRLVLRVCCCSDVDVCEYPRPLLARPAGSLHLPERLRVRNCSFGLGCDRSPAHVLCWYLVSTHDFLIVPLNPDGNFQIFAIVMVFPRRSTPPNSILLPRKEVSLILLALHQYPRVLLRRQLYPTCNGY